MSAEDIRQKIEFHRSELERRNAELEKIAKEDERSAIAIVWTHIDRYNALHQAAVAKTNELKSEVDELFSAEASIRLSMYNDKLMDMRERLANLAVFLEGWPSRKEKLRKKRKKIKNIISALKSCKKLNINPPKELSCADLSKERYEHNSIKEEIYRGECRNNSANRVVHNITYEISEIEKEINMYKDAAEHKIFRLSGIKIKNYDYDKFSRYLTLERFFPEYNTTWHEISISFSHLHFKKSKLVREFGWGCPTLGPVVWLELKEWIDHEVSGSGFGGYDVPRSKWIKRSRK